MYLRVILMYRQGRNREPPVGHTAATHGLTASPAVAGLGVSRRARSGRCRRSEGVEGAAPAAPAAKSLKSAGYPQRRVAACIQTGRR